jgi:hypothetical protein
LQEDPGEFHNVAPRNADAVAAMERLMLDRFRSTHPEAAQEPKGLAAEEALEWYVRPRDVQVS